MKTIAERISALTVVDHETDCWTWIGSCDRDGYGLIKIGGRRGHLRAAHRVSYAEHKGAIPEGLEIDHLCRNTRCVNPNHLEAVTGQENRRRAGILMDAQCRNGHPRTVGNTYITPAGYRSCRDCHRRSSQRHRERTTP